MRMEILLRMIQVNQKLALPVSGLYAQISNGHHNK